MAKFIWSLLVSAILTGSILSQKASEKQTALTKLQKESISLQNASVASFGKGVESSFEVILKPTVTIGTPALFAKEATADAIGAKKIVYSWIKSLLQTLFAEIPIIHHQKIPGGGYPLGATHESATHASYKSPPMSPTLRCLTWLAIQFFVLHSALWAVKAANHFTYKVSTSRLQRILEASNKTCCHIPMLCTLFLGVRLRQFQVGQNDDSWQTVQAAQMVSIGAIVVQLVVILWAAAFTEVSCEDDGTLRHKRMNSPELGSVFNVMRYAALGGLYGGIVALTTAWIQIEHRHAAKGEALEANESSLKPTATPSAVIEELFLPLMRYGDVKPGHHGEPHKCYIAYQIIVICCMYFLVHLLLIMAREYRQLYMRTDLREEYALSLAGDALTSTSPFLALLFIAAKMRKTMLNANEMSVMEMDIALLSLMGLVFACFLAPYFVQSGSFIGMQQGSMGMIGGPKASPGQKVCMFIRWVCLIGLYSSVGVILKDVIYMVPGSSVPPVTAPFPAVGSGSDATPVVLHGRESVATPLTTGLLENFTIDSVLKPDDAKPKFAPLSPTMKCLITLLVVSYGFYACLLAVALIQQYSLSPKQFERVMRTLESCRPIVGVCPMLVSLFIGARIRARTITVEVTAGQVVPVASPMDDDPQSVIGEPPAYVQDAMFRGTFALMAQMVLTFVLNFSFVYNPAQIAARASVSHPELKDGRMGRSTDATIPSSARSVQSVSSTRSSGDFRSEPPPSQNGVEILNCLTVLVMYVSIGTVVVGTYTMSPAAIFRQEKYQ